MAIQVIRMADPSDHDELILAITMADPGDHDERNAQTSDDRSLTLQEHHTAARERSLARLTIFGPDGLRDPREAVMAPTFTAKLYDAPRSRPLSLIPASDALPMALGKMWVEMPITDAFLISKPPTDALHPNDLRPLPIPPLHPITEMLIRRDRPAGGEGNLHRFQQALAQDSTWNRETRRGHLAKSHSVGG